MGRDFFLSNFFIDVSKKLSSTLFESSKQTIDLLNYLVTRVEPTIGEWTLLVHSGGNTRLEYIGNESFEQGGKSTLRDPV